MRLLRLLPVAAIAGVISAMIVVGSDWAPQVQAQTRITVPGAGPLYYPNLIAQLPLGRLYLLGTGEEGGAPLSVLQGYDALNHMIGENWFPGSTAQVVNYPASIGLLSFGLAAPGTDAGVAMGRGSLDDQIKNAAAYGDPVAIAGLSEGTLVINRELEHLATDPNAPSADLLSFAMFAGPELGLAHTYLPVGTTVPLIDYTAHDLADSQYDVSVVFHQYDVWADPPDRPWNLLAVANSLVATLYFHNNTATVVPSDVAEVSSVTSDLGGTTTTYIIPSSTLPLLKPLQQLGVPTKIVDAMDSTLKPIVDAGYSRLTPNAGPYFSQGRLLGPPAPFGTPTDIPKSAQDSKKARAVVDSAPAGQGAPERSATPETTDVPTGSTANDGDRQPEIDTATHAVRTPTRTTPGRPVGTRGHGSPKHVAEGVRKPTRPSRAATAHRRPAARSHLAAHARSLGSSRTGSPVK